MGPSLLSPLGASPRGIPSFSGTSNFVSRQLRRTVPSTLDRAGNAESGEVRELYVLINHHHARKEFRSPWVDKGSLGKLVTSSMTWPKGSSGGPWECVPSDKTMSVREQLPAPPELSTVWHWKLSIVPCCQRSRWGIVGCPRSKVSSCSSPH